MHLLRSYPGAYAPPTSMIGPPGPDYSYCSPIGRAPEHRDIDPGGGVGEGESYNLVYPTKVGLGFMNNPIRIRVDNLGVANVGRLNNPRPSEACMTDLSPNLDGAALSIPPSGQTPEY